MTSGSEEAARLVIATACEDDIAALIELYEHLVPADRPFSEEDAKEIWRRFSLYQGSAIYLGKIGERLVSTCTLVVVPNLTRGGLPYALIENVVTHRDFRGRGFGRAVLEAAVKAAWQNGCYKAMLLTSSQRPETLAFYRSAGFENTKTGFEIRRVQRRPER